jgi:hypothetical protein
MDAHVGGRESSGGRLLHHLQRRQHRRARPLENEP